MNLKPHLNKSGIITYRNGKKMWTLLLCQDDRNDDVCDVRIEDGWYEEHCLHTGRRLRAGTVKLSDGTEHPVPTGDHFDIIEFRPLTYEEAEAEIRHIRKTTPELYRSGP